MRLSTGSKVFSLVMLSIMGGVLYVLLQAGTSNGAPDEAGAPVTVEIPEGASADQVGDILTEAGVVDNALSFQVKVRTDPRAANIQPGSYELRQGMTNDQILDRLTETVEFEAFTVTIPEGLTVEQTLQRIAEADDSPFEVRQLRNALAGVAVPSWVPTDLPGDAEPFEGLLAPDTYEFRADVGAQDLLGSLVHETEDRLRSLDVRQRNYYDTLITASLIEREVRVADEQRTVSSVIANRLDAGQPLQLDATVLYAKGEAGTRVLTDDTDVDSPWNTYENTGLPPTPIAAPGQAALEAAANPANTNFVFYVVCDFDTGEHAFARTLEQHNRNVAQYRRIRDQQGGSYCDDAA
jgi:UPF0755 protein